MLTLYIISGLYLYFLYDKKEGVSKLEKTQPDEKEAV